MAASSKEMSLYGTWARALLPCGPRPCAAVTGLLSSMSTCNPASPSPHPWDWQSQPRVGEVLSILLRHVRCNFQMGVLCTAVATPKCVRQLTRRLLGERWRVGGAGSVACLHVSDDGWWVSCWLSWFLGPVSPGAGPFTALSLHK